MPRFRSFSGRRLVVLAALVVLSLTVVAMVAVRVNQTGYDTYSNLVWNLFLAWIPLGLALVIYDGAKRGLGAVWVVVFAGLWLLFFPNAPYLTTDMKYLRELGGAPLWYDVSLTGLAAFTGLALGLVSLYLVHSVARTYFGAILAWVGVWAVLALSSIGVFLGRFQRFNSWDVFTDPGPILGDVAKGLADPLNYPRTLAVTVVFGGFLIASYLVFYALAQVTASPGTEVAREGETPRSSRS
jgi:uncharacterized membrane protein